MTYLPDDRAVPGAPASGERAGSRRALGCAFEIVETLVLTLVIYLLIHNFLAQPFEVQQTSMVPTIAPEEYILIDKLTPRFDGYHHGDVIVFQPPPGSGLEAEGVPFIKRVIGMPGDRVDLMNGRVYVTPPGGVPMLIEEPYVVRTADGQPAPTTPKDANGTTSWVVPAESYFVLGDNRPDSQDSRAFGAVGKDLVLGRAWLRYFPLERIGLLERPHYPNLEPADESGFDRRMARDYSRAGSSATIQVSTARS